MECSRQEPSNSLGGNIALSPNAVVVVPQSVLSDIGTTVDVKTAVIGREVFFAVTVILERR